MLTKEQEIWIAHLRDDDKITIKPFDSTTSEKFEKVKDKIQDFFGYELRVEHHGATSMGISGQDEIDVYIPVSPKDFEKYIEPLKQLFGEPGSLYPLERARFVTIEDGKHVDVFLINEECDGWKNSVRFEKYLKTHLEALEQYRQLKEAGNGISTREYYRRKIEFINKILSQK